MPGTKYNFYRLGGMTGLLTMIILLQQAHWPTHMSTCAQNQSNQEEEGNDSDSHAPPPPPGATSGSGGGHEAVQHFLATSQAANGGGGGRPPSRPSNGVGPQPPNRGIQVRQVCI